MARQHQVEEAREGGLRVALPSQPSFSTPFPAASTPVTVFAFRFLASRFESELKTLPRLARGEPFFSLAKTVALATATGAMQAECLRECGEGGDTHNALSNDGRGVCDN